MRLRGIKAPSRIFPGDDLGASGLPNNAAAIVPFCDYKRRAKQNFTIINTRILYTVAL